MNLLDIVRPEEKDKKWLVSELFRRSAELYEQSGKWQEAAECWGEAGENSRAAELYLHTIDYIHAAPLCLAEGRYAEALDCYQHWLALIPEDDIGEQVTAKLGIAACLSLMHGDPEAAQEAYYEARALIEGETIQNPLSSGRCWEALGIYGIRVGRSDLIQLGYEHALAYYGKQYNDERLRAAQDYFLAVQKNRLLAEDIEIRLTEWGERLSD